MSLKIKNKNNLKKYCQLGEIIISVPLKINIINVSCL